MIKSVYRGEKMDDRRKTVFIFLINFLWVFLVVGYAINNYLVEIDWVDGVPWWVKFRSYYMSRISSNLIISAIMAGMITLIIKLKMRK